MPNREEAWISADRTGGGILSSTAVCQLYDAGSAGSVETMDLWLTKPQTVL